MADNGLPRDFKKDVVIWQEGNRILHYTLRDAARNRLLAVVGIEIGERHFKYSVSAEFLRAFGSTSTVNVETKWTSNQEVVNWLEPLAAIKDPIFPIASRGLTGKSSSLECLESSMAHLSSHKNPNDDEGSKKSTSDNSEIMWSGEAWVCNKQLKHYPSFCRRGIKIDTYSFVYVMGETETEYLAYVQDLYEDLNHMKMVRVRWFNFPKDIEDLTSDTETHAREVFMTSHGQDISAECVNGLATVLTPNHFDICLKYIPESLPAETFLCHREVRNKKIKDFYFSQFHGYSSQAILSCLIRNPRYVADGLLHVSNRRKLVQGFNVNDDVEILCQDSGLRGCWFRCKILHVSQNRLNVQHCDVLDEDAGKNLKEWVPSPRVANLDELGMRHAERLTIRPLSSEGQSDSTEFNIGSAVDAWWCDGWWEGVLIGFVSLNNLRLFFPGEKLSVTIERKNVRASKDWVDGKWMSIEPNPDILSAINSILNPTPQPPQPPA